MAGRGTRLLPHTATVSKPLFKILEKPIVHLLIEQLANTLGGKIEQLAFVLNKQSVLLEKTLTALSARIGILKVPLFFYQREALGTGHAIRQACTFLDGPLTIAFADTLFDLIKPIDLQKDVVIYTKSVPDPSSFGTVKLNKRGEVLEFVEKPQTFISDLAIIGIYYFRRSELLRKHLNWLIETDLRVNNEYQFTDTLTKMRQDGIKIHTVQVDTWLDCGNKDNILATHCHYLLKRPQMIGKDVHFKNSSLIEPVYIGDDVKIENSVIGPFTSIASQANIQNCIIQASIIQEKTYLKGLNISDSIVGSQVQYTSKSKKLNLGAYSTISE